MSNIFFRCFIFTILFAFNFKVHSRDLDDTSQAQIDVNNLKFKQLEEKYNFFLEQIEIRNTERINSLSEKSKIEIDYLNEKINYYLWTFGIIITLLSLVGALGIWQWVKQKTTRLINNKITDIVTQEYVKNLIEEKGKDAINKSVKELILRFENELEELGSLKKNYNDSLKVLNDELKVKTNEYSTANSGAKSRTEGIVISDKIVLKENEFNKFINDLESFKTQNNYTFFDWLLKGNSEFYKNEYEKALIHWSKALETGMETFELLYNVATAHLKLKEYKKAIEFYTKAIELNPKDHITYNDRGVAYNAMKNFEAAILDFDKAIELKDDEARPYSNRGNSFASLGNKEKAFENFNKAIQLDGKNWIYYFDRAHYQYEIGEVHEAIRDYEKSLDLNPNSELTLNNLGVIYLDNLKKYEIAIEYFKKAIILNPSESYYYNLANAYIYSKKFPMALDTCNEGIEKDSNNLRLYLIRSTTYINLNDIINAEKDLELILQNNDKEHLPGVLINRAIINTTQRNYEGAIANYLEAIGQEFSNYKDELWASINLIELFVITNKFSKAIELIKNYATKFSDPRDKVLSIFYKIVVEVLEGRDSTELESQIDKEVIHLIDLNEWSFNNFNEWLESNDFDNLKKEKIKTILKKILKQIEN